MISEKKIKKILKENKEVFEILEKNDALLFMPPKSGGDTKDTPVMENTLIIDDIISQN